MLKRIGFVISVVMVICIFETQLLAGDEQAQDIYYKELARACAVARTLQNGCSWSGAGTTKKTRRTSLPSVGFFGPGPPIYEHKYIVHIANESDQPVTEVFLVGSWTSISSRATGIPSGAYVKKIGTLDRGKNVTVSALLSSSRRRASPSSQRSSYRLSGQFFYLTCKLPENRFPIWIQLETKKNPEEKEANAKLKEANYYEYIGKREKATQIYDKILREYSKTKAAQSLKTLLKSRKKRSLKVARAEFDKAKKHESAGRSEQAKQLYLEFVRDYPKMQIVESLRKKLNISSDADLEQKLEVAYAKDFVSLTLLDAVRNVVNTRESEAEARRRTANSSSRTRQKREPNIENAYEIKRHEKLSEPSFVRRLLIDYGQALVNVDLYMQKGDSLKERSDSTENLTDGIQLVLQANDTYRKAELERIKADKLRLLILEASKINRGGVELARMGIAEDKSLSKLLRTKLISADR